MVNLVNEGFDCAVRFGELPDSSLVSLKLGENRRVCVASPDYLAARGEPEDLAALAAHNCLALGASANQQRGWVFQQDGKGRDDQGVGHDGMFRWLGAARMVSGRARARVVIMVGSGYGYRRGTARERARCVRRAADRDSCGVPAETAFAVTGAVVSRFA